MVYTRNRRGIDATHRTVLCSWQGVGIQSFVLLLLIRRRSEPARQRCNPTGSPRLATQLPCSLALSLVFVPGEIRRSRGADFLFFPGRQTLARQGANSSFTAISAQTSAERPFDGFVDGVIKDIGEEGDHSETQLNLLASGPL